MSLALQISLHEIPWRKHRDPGVAGSRQEVLVSTDDDLGVAGNGARQEFIVIRVTTYPLLELGGASHDCLPPPAISSQDFRNSIFGNRRGNRIAHPGGGIHPKIGRRITSRTNTSTARPSRISLGEPAKKTPEMKTFLSTTIFIFVSGRWQWLWPHRAGQARRLCLPPGFLDKGVKLLHRRSLIPFNTTTSFCAGRQTHPRP